MHHHPTSNYLLNKQRLFLERQRKQRQHKTHTDVASPTTSPIKINKSVILSTPPQQLQTTNLLHFSRPTGLNPLNIFESPRQKTPKSVSPRLSVITSDPFDLKFEQKQKQQHIDLVTMPHLETRLTETQSQLSENLQNRCHEMENSINTSLEELKKETNQKFFDISKMLTKLSLDLNQIQEKIFQSDVLYSSVQQSVLTIQSQQPDFVKLKTKISQTKNGIKQMYGTATCDLKLWYKNELTDKEILKGEEVLLFYPTLQDNNNDVWIGVRRIFDNGQMEDFSVLFYDHKEQKVTFEHFRL